MLRASQMRCAVVARFLQSAKDAAASLFHPTRCRGIRCARYAKSCNNPIRSVAFLRTIARWGWCRFSA